MLAGHRKLSCTAPLATRLCLTLCRVRSGGEGHSFSRRSSLSTTDTATEQLHSVMPLALALQVDQSSCPRPDMNKEKGRLSAKTKLIKTGCNVSYKAKLVNTVLNRNNLY